MPCVWGGARGGEGGLAIFSLGYRPHNTVIGEVGRFEHGGIFMGRLWSSVGVDEATH